MKTQTIIDELKKAIEIKKSEIKAKQKEIDNFEIDPDDYAEQYDDILNEEGDVKVAGLTFSPAQIVKELDPTAYRCGLNDYVDSIDKTELTEYMDLEEELEELENELTDLENELEEKEDHGKKAATSRENGKKGGRPCNHCAGDGGASDYDRKRYCPGDECASCGCTLGDDWYWYIDRDQAPGYPDFK